MATIVKKKKDHKKLDEFISTSEKLTVIIGDNWRLFSAILAVSIVSLLIFAYLGNVKSKKRDQMFWEISKIDSGLSGQPVVKEWEQIADEYEGIDGVVYAEFTLAKHLLMAGDSDKGEKILSEVKNRYPSSLFAALAELELGYHLEFSGKCEEAMDYYQAIIGGDVSFTKAEAYLGLGRCQELAGKKNAARDTFKEFIRKFPGHISQEFAKMRIRVLEI